MSCTVDDRVGRSSPWILGVAFLFLMVSSGSVQAQQRQTPPPSAAKADEVAKVEQAAPGQATAPTQGRKLLVFYRCEGFFHGCIPLACRTIEILGQKTGAFETVFSADMEVFTADKLAEFDAVLFNNTTRLAFANPEHRKALMEFVKGGKGIIGLHAASDNFYDWPEAAAMMGGLFDGHPWGAGGTWAVANDEPAHPLNAAFGGRNFMIKDEIYQLKDPYSRADLRVLLTLDMQQEVNYKVNPAGMHRPDLDFAIAWVRKVGDGRLFYCSLGHNHEVFWNPAVLQHYLDGIQYALGDLEVDDSCGRELLARADLAAFRGDTGTWMMAGDVALDPSNAQRLRPTEGIGVVVNGKDGRTRHLFTKQHHGDVEAHIEFMVPEGSNSGAYFQGRYEIQVLDSWGVQEPQHSDCGGIYQRWREEDVPERGYEGRPPRVNASRKPGEWQTFDVTFRAPRFDAQGKKTANAVFVRVVHNGVVIHENVELSGPTRAPAFKDEKPFGPLMLQGDHGPVAYRNLRLTPIE